MHLNNEDRLLPPRHTVTASPSPRLELEAHTPGRATRKYSDQTARRLTRV